MPYSSVPAPSVAAISNCHKKQTLKTLPFKRFSRTAVSNKLRNEGVGAFVGVCRCMWQVLESKTQAISLAKFCRRFEGTGSIGRFSRLYFRKTLVSSDDYQTLSHPRRQTCNMAFPLFRLFHMCSRGDLEQYVSLGVVGDVSSVCIYQLLYSQNN